MQVDQLAANEQVVREITNHLMQAFEQFVNDHPDDYVDYVDALMAAHNFHVVMVLDIEQRVKANPERQLFLRRMAIDTFKQGLERRE